MFCCSFCVGLFLFLLFFVDWTSRSEIDSSLFLACLSDRLRGNPVRNHIMTICLVFGTKSIYMLYTHHYNNTTKKKDERRLLEKICTSDFIVTFVVWEGDGDRTELQYFDPHSYGRQRCVFLVSWCSTRGPGTQISAECWLSLPHLITNGSPKLLGAPWAPSAGCGFLTTSCLRRFWSPTQSGAPRATSASCGFRYHILSATSLDPIVMCHILPLHHFGMAYLPGSKVKIQHSFEKITLCLTQPRTKGI